MTANKVRDFVDNIREISGKPMNVSVDSFNFSVGKMNRELNLSFNTEIVGHKHLNTTQKYMHLLAGTSGEWIVERTTDKKRAKQLLAADFIYQLTTPDGVWLGGVLQFCTSKNQELSKMEVTRELHRRSLMLHC